MKNEDMLIDLLVDYINEKWERELSELSSFHAASEGDEQASIELIETFVRFCEERKIISHGGLTESVCLRSIKKMLARVLAVDMSGASNRKGDLPKAMGLVSRRDEVNRIRDRVIYFAYDHAMHNLGEINRTHEECADLVSRAFEKSAKLKPTEGPLTTDKVTKTYQRMLQEILGN